MPCCIAFNALPKRADQLSQFAILLPQLQQKADHQPVN
jgi:hypothetical protein